MFFETFSNRSVYSQLSDENVIVHFLPPILELCTLQQQLLAGQLNVFVRCEKTYSLKPALHSPIYILLMYYILHKYYYYNLLYKSFPVSLSKRSLNQCSFWFFLAWVFNFFGTDFSCSGVGITGQILIVPLWDFSSQKWSLVF